LNEDSLYVVYVTLEPG